MSTSTDAQADAVHQLRGQLDRTRAGRRLERLYHSHEREVAALVAVHPDVRQHLSEAARRLAEATETGKLEPTTVRAAARALADLNRLGTMELRRTVAMLDEDLANARGRSLEALLHD